jgi:hypothetical protein|mmetsp:Transcript_67833/g.113670  ORF Transcript_67833/g.113670 Transcript_67833/m.113670 type:complete len:199 (-) Transcript_67833:1405-2001(-)|eukprot:CAMPEP_0174296964 /NCGR_PEP_ID=MMETSP0809-20121228/49551_1 /TAXON_ID=73025 ORGANISM="Eutreptiella gymnastica-like, Strain CCMP1594" /NCGR_SAMPLE_ID=MMETSP0809 /ASSEMBLY_ACC=CAM_ASM_000658 /LENGTH=198 /DNA_ID=CAMNT_0015400377 /DNA_START=31 /DNA_END=627 /DNA_ORIENTATION=+
MNCPTISLCPFKVGPTNIKDVLRCLIHTIVFQRVLSPVLPLDVEAGFLDVTYCKIADAAVDAQIEESIDKFCKSLKKKEPRRSLIVEFYPPRKKSPTNWFAKEDKVCWEYWMINLNVVFDGDDRSLACSAVSNQGTERLEKDLVERMKSIIKHTDAAIDNNHVPPLKDTPCFPFEVKFDSQSQSWPGSLMEWVKYGHS